MESVAEQASSPALHAGLAYARALMAADAEVEPRFEAALKADTSVPPFLRARVQPAEGEWLRQRKRSSQSKIREADEAIERASAGLDDTIRQLGGLGLLGRPASQETLQKLTKALDHAHAARARLGDRGESNIIGPDDIDKLREPAKRLAAW